MLHNIYKSYQRPCRDQFRCSLKPGAVLEVFCRNRSPTYHPSINILTQTCKLVMCTSRSSLFSCFFRQISHTKCLVLLCILSLALKYFLPGILKGQYLQLLKVTSALTLDILSLVPSLFGVPFFLLSIVLHSDSTSDSTSW